MYLRGWINRSARRVVLRSGWLALILVALLAAFPLAAQERSGGIVVWRLEAKTGVTEKDIDSISGFVTAEVERHSARRAVSDADIKTLLHGEQVRQQCGDDGTSCIAEIGAALGVPEAVSGDLGRLGDYWIFNLRRINVREADVIARVSKQIRGDMNALIEAIPGAVGELFHDRRPAEAAPAPTPAPAAAPAPATAEQTPASPPAPEGPGMSPLNKAALGTFIPGLAVLALGGVGHWQMVKAQEDGRAGASDAESRHSTWKGVAGAGYGVGGALVATGIVLWIVEAARDKDGQEQEAAPVQLGLTPVRDGFSACIWGRW